MALSRYKHFCIVTAAIPVSARLTAVGVHLSPPPPQQVMQAELTGGVVMVEIPLRSYRLLKCDELKNIYIYMTW